METKNKTSINKSVYESQQLQDIKYLLMNAIAIMLTSKISIRLTINRQKVLKCIKKVA